MVERTTSCPLTSTLVPSLKFLMLYILFKFFFSSSMSIAASLVSEDTKTKFLNKMGQLTTSGAMLANVFQRKK
jgi:hypothetical protein